MSAIITTGSTLQSKLVSALLGLVPSAWKTLFRGPATTIAIGPDSAKILESRHWTRPVEVLLDPQLIMHKRLTLPAAARTDLASSIELMVLSATPFDVSELLIEARELDQRPIADEVAFDVYMTPRDIIHEGLAALGLPLWRVIRISAIQPDSPKAALNFAPALGGVARVLRLTPALPCAALVIALIVLSQTHLANLRMENGILDVAIAEQQTAIRFDLGQLAAHQERLTAQALVDKAFEETPSSFLLLEQLRSYLPVDASLGRLALDGAALRIEVRAPDMLQLLRHLTEAMPEWRPSVEGSIARSPDGTTDMATLLLSRTP